MNNDINPLYEIFFNNASNSIQKLIDYFDVYHQHFGRFRNKKIRLLEIGIQNGGSTRMWKKYFGPDAEIVCVDIDPACLELQSEGYDVWIGDQESKEFWETLKLKYDYFDIVIDDGGHTMRQQINTFESIFPIVKDGGVYLCEDTCTSYMPIYGGGLNDPQSFIEYSKRLVDEMHGWWHQKIEALDTNQIILNNLQAVSFYDSIVVFQKKKRNPPTSYSRGQKGHIRNPASQNIFEMRRLFGIAD